MRNILILFSILLISCGPSAEEIAARKKRYDDYLIMLINIRTSVAADTTKKTTVVEALKIRHWDSKEIRLPSGVIEETGCSPKNTKDNYVTIKKSDGVSTIVRDIDEDLYLNLSVGDIVE